MCMKVLRLKCVGFGVKWIRNQVKTLKKGQPRQIWVHDRSCPSHNRSWTKKRHDWSCPLYDRSLHGLHVSTPKTPIYQFRPNMELVEGSKQNYGHQR